MVAEIDPQPGELLRLRDVFHRDDRTDANIDLLEDGKRDRRLYGCW